MRLTFVLNNYPPRVGGVEIHVQNLARRLAARGHDITVLTLADEPGDTVEDGVRVLRFGEHLRVGGVLAFPGPSTVRRVWREVRASEVVSVHTRFFPMTWLGVEAARTARVPVILTEHGSDHVAAASPVIGVASKLVDVTLGRRAWRRATRVVGVSDAVVSFVRRFGGVEATVFANAIELPPPADDVSARPDHLVFVGRLVPGKGWPAFIDAVAQVRAHGRPVTGEILGDGPDKPAVEARLVAAGLDDVVAVRGRVPMADVLAALSGATLVNPTTLAEGFQTTLLEALAAGGRVVTYPVPGAELLADQGAPVQVVARSAAALASGVEQIADAGAWPHERLKPWGWTARVEQYERLMAEVTAGDNGATPH